MATLYLFSTHINKVLLLNTVLKSHRCYFPLTRNLCTKSLHNLNESTPKFEITTSPDDWKYVERLLPQKVNTAPQTKPEYPSGWTPPTDNLSEKYFIPRNRNFMIPVYMSSSHRGMRKVTEIKRIQGDVFQLEKDLKQFLETELNRKIATQVNELVGYIHIKGDFVSKVKEFLTNKGF